jgi:hypothetical protein
MIKKPLRVTHGLRGFFVLLSIEKNKNLTSLQVLKSPKQNEVRIGIMTVRIDIYGVRFLQN